MIILIRPFLVPLVEGAYYQWNVEKGGCSDGEGGLIHASYCILESWLSSLAEIPETCVSFFHVDENKIFLFCPSMSSSSLRTTDEGHVCLCPHDWPGHHTSLL